ncbi:MAG: hypothetical protein RQ894_01595 [Candidatus Pacebacteria bacterium]|nr:hypothetical protein [Candidatus Paceibacterota bacterium]
MTGFNPETSEGDNKNLISRLERISRNCENILDMITIATRRNGSKRPSFKDNEVNEVKNNVNAISADVEGFLRELESSKIDNNQKVSLEKNIRALAAEIMTLIDLLKRLESQEVDIYEIQTRVKSIQEIVDNIKNNLRRSR